MKSNVTYGTLRF